MHRYFIIYKPFQVLSQFSSIASIHTGIHVKQTLKDFFDVPNDVYPVGRLDYDSEGLLILTNDATINHRLLNPSFEHEREYWVQVEGIVTTSALEELQLGVEMVIEGKPHRSKKASATIFDSSPAVPERDPPIRFRKNIPTSWISLSITEGKNRQVRKMTAKVGYPTLRLIRYRIAKLTIAGLKPGEMKELGKEEILAMLF